MIDLAIPDQPTAPKRKHGGGRVKMHVGMPLTAKQQAVWDLQQAGKTFQEIATIRGISKCTVGNMLVVIRKKLGLSLAKHITEPGRTERQDPERAAAVIDAITEPDPYVKVKEAFKAAGLPAPVSESLIRRLRVKYMGAVTEFRNLKTADLLELINKKIHHATLYLDDKVLGEASARDLMLGISALIEKRQLLRGEPTQIISNYDRMKLNELLPAIIAEGQRRGITVDGVATRVENEPVGTAR